MNKKNIVIFIVTAIVLIVVIVKTKFDRQEEYDLGYENIVTSLENTSEEIVSEDDSIKVHITGEINNPGLIKLTSGDRILDAIEKAGGVTDMADTSKVNLAYILSDGEKIYIPSINDEDDVEFIENSTKNSKVNINTATLEQLQTLNGIGETIAQSIIDYRDQNGKFSSIEEIKNVSGIGDSKFEKIKDYITVK